jgi:hypothetical protein
MKIKDLTDKEIENYSEIELLNMDLTESVDKILNTTKKFKTVLNHFIASTLLATLCSFLFSFGLYTPILFVPSIIFLFLVNRFGNDKKTALISFKMSILFYKESGIIDESNEYLVEKYLNRIYNA